MKHGIARITPGAGLVAVYGPLTVLLGPEALPIREAIWLAIRSGDIGQVLDSLVSDGVPSVPTFVIGHVEGTDLRLFFRGDADVTVHSATGSDVLDGSGLRTWSERLTPDWSDFTAQLRTEPDHEASQSSWVESGLVSGCACSRSADDEPSIEVAHHEREAAVIAVGENDPHPVDEDLTEDDVDDDVAPDVAPVSESLRPEAEPEVSQPEAANAATEVEDQSPYADMFGATRHRSVLDAAVDDPEVLPADPTDSESVIDGSDVASGHDATWPSRDFDAEAASSTGEQADSDHDGYTLSVEEVRRLRSEGSDSALPERAFGALGPKSVQALICPDGHPNPPYDASCRVCGAGLEGSPTVIDRPPLGRLRFSTGDDVVLDRPLIVGRKPDPTGRRFSDIPRELKLDVGDGLSRSHALVHLEGWQVRIEDLGSTNHTTVTLPGRPPQRLREGQPVLVVDGTVIDLGGEVECVFDAAL
jgi:hypothetical protein